MSYPPTPQRKSCNCSDPCISTDDVYYAGPNLPNSGINTYNVLTEVIEKLDAIYAVPTLQRVTEMGNTTTLPIIADSFVKIGGDGNNILLDNGTVLPIGDIGNQDLQSVIYKGNYAQASPSNTASYINFLQLNELGYTETFLYNYDQLTNDGATLSLSSNGDATLSGQKDDYQGTLSVLDGKIYLEQKNPNYLENTRLIFETPVEDTIIKIPAKLTSGTYTLATIDDILPFVPSDYDLDEFTNSNVDPFAHVSDIPAPLGYTPVNKAGDTMLGDLILNEDPTNALGAATKQYVDNRLVVETTSGYTLTNADSGGIVIFKTTAAQTLTIPTGLADGFECTFVTLAGVTLTVSATGVTLNNNTGTVMLPQLSFTLKRMLATNTYITAGSL
jgi:hypothetical protein